MSEVVALMFLLVTSGLAVSEASFKSLQDEGRSSFTPTATNSHSMSRPVAPLSPAYAQNRDSYANAAAPQTTYSVPGGTQGGTAAASSSSYAAPATGGAAGGYGQGPGQSMTYYYYHYPAQQPMGGYGDMAEDDEGGFDGAGIGGLAGLLGLKGLKGLGGIGLLALLKILKKLFLPVLLPLVLLPLLLLIPLILLFIPIPVITIPAAGNRGLEADGVGSLVANKAYQTAQVAQEVLTSANCVERIACELSTRSHGTYLDKLITEVFEKTESMSSKKWKRAMRAYIDSGFHSEAKNETHSDSLPVVGQSACSKYACDLYKEFTSRLSVKTNSTAPASIGFNEVPT